ncbi:mannosyltransferase family protein [Cryobacterium sp. PH31-L1]|uniref:mannosyltransferase family protein n=1 Tax=Cryobacterium sp. PH31-L1 TaxID=3046199 RepID=UPI0024BB86F6|nr:mannosyltransferase family protein [Cryobacterium sp. PH31-L1]MDJ0377498.1 mannosyltransferase family protein [Cryobacterium sp. PH31-L1]
MTIGGGAERLRALHTRLGQLPPWGLVLLIWGFSRLLTTALLGTVFAAVSRAGWTFASFRRDPTFFTFSGSWDSSFYRQIALHGYPSELPTDASGNVEPNAWAFLPVFPWLSRGLAQLTGLDFYVAGVLVATLFGALAALALYRLLEPRVGRHSALWAVVLFCFGPLSFILQVAYAESLFLFLVFASLWAMMERRYLLMIPFAVVAAFTRPGVLALSLALALLLLLRWRERELFPWRERWAIVAAGLSIAAAGLAWPLVADAVTGVHDAYLATELSWWTGFVGRTSFVPLTPWFLMAGRYLGVAGIVLVLLLVAGFGWWLSRRALHPLRPDVIAYSASYGLYLVAVFLPQQSLFRLLLPLAPLLGGPMIARSKPLRRGLLVGSIALQPVAIWLLWFIGYP